MTVYDVVYPAHFCKSGIRGRHQRRSNQILGEPHSLAALLLTQCPTRPNASRLPPNAARKLAATAA